jgi:Fe-S oxidoreductase
VRERFPDIPRRVSGYNLDELLPENGFNVARALVGTEGTCVTILEATVRLVPSPQHRVTVVLGYPDVFAAADHTPEILTHGPIGLEGMDSVLTKNMEAKGRLRRERERLPEGEAWLLVEFGADSHEEALDQARRAHEAIESGSGPHLNCRVLEQPADTLAAWTVRESAVGDSRLPGKVEMEGAWEDAAVHPDRLGVYLREFQDLLDSHGYHCTYYGHFSQGCVHTRIDFDFRSAEGMRNFRSFMESAADLVTAHGGSIAGEYGEGQGRAELLPRMFGPELVRGFEEFKAVWDPAGKMNPGKVVNAYRLDENLRFGPDHHPADPATVFSFAADGGSFAKATERCFGMGKCRVPGGATMCPSYQVTGEEKHSTRGRARLLMEMLKGEVITDGWRSEEVHEALDLCLSCKGCKGDCPVQVDMATYKAEFLSHYYRRRLRPRSAYAMGLIPWWARLARRAPGLANAVGASALGKAAAGVAPERTPPPFARETFRKWLAGRGAAPGDGRPTVVLWPDTFTNHFQPEVGRAAVEVLEDAGFHVRVPERSFCCGRPLYDYGMLALARRLLRGVLSALEPDIRAGHPVVVLEPSCASVFRDELPNMLPDEEAARRLADQTHVLSEVLARHAPGWEPPRVERRALLHGHCHQKAVIGVDCDRELLERMGLELELLDSGCCGMAGSFGYERGERYEVSIKAGERALLPRVREADDDTLVVTDGFSCREQIAQGAEGRRALHLAEVLVQGVRGRATTP